MGEIAGLWEYELESVVQRSSITGSMHVRTHDGNDLIVKVQNIAPERICPDLALI